MMSMIHRQTEYTYSVFARDALRTILAATCSG